MKISLEFRFPLAAPETIEVDSSDALPSVGDHIMSSRGVLHLVVNRLFVYRPGQLQGVVLEATIAT